MRKRKLEAVTGLPTMIHDDDGEEDRTNLSATSRPAAAATGGELAVPTATTTVQPNSAAPPNRAEGDPPQSQPQPSPPQPRMLATTMQPLDSTRPRQRSITQRSFSSDGLKGPGQYPLDAATEEGDEQQYAEEHEHEHATLSSFPVQLHTLLTQYEVDFEQKQEANRYLWEEETTEHQQFEIYQETTPTTTQQSAVSSSCAAARTTKRSSTNKWKRIEDELAEAKAVAADVCPIVEWCNTNAFKIHDVARFTTELLPRFFPPPQMHAFDDFQRNLNLWGFTHIIFVEGRNHATRHIHICSHPFFVKGQGELVTAMRKRHHHDGTTAARSGNGPRSSRTGRDGGTVARVTTPLGSGGRGEGTTIGRNKDGNKYIINHVV